MKLNVPEEVLRETTKCQNDFSCLSSGKGRDYRECEVSYVNGKNVLVLTSKNIFECPYRIAFGYVQICKCPTNFVVQKQYK